MSSLTLMRGLCLRQKLLRNNEQTPLSSPLSLLSPLSLHIAAAQVLPFHCGPLRCPEGSSLWARDGQSPKQARYTWKRGWKKKTKLHFGIKNEISSGGKEKKTQCNVFYCVQVTPSIKSEINLDVIYKEQLQRKGRGVTVIFQKTWESCFFFSFLCLFVTPVAECIQKNAAYYYNFVPWHRSTKGVFWKYLKLLIQRLWTAAFVCAFSFGFDRELVKVPAASKLRFCLNWKSFGLFFKKRICHWGSCNFPVF